MGMTQPQLVHMVLHHTVQELIDTNRAMLDFLKTTVEENKKLKTTEKLLSRKDIYERWGYGETAGKERLDAFIKFYKIRPIRLGNDGKGDRFRTSDIEKIELKLESRK